MTTHTSVALWVIGIGLAIAALAGVPLISADVVSGPGFWWSGLAVAAGGVVVLLTAVRGQRKANARVRVGRDLDEERLALERRSLNIRIAHNRRQRERLIVQEPTGDGMRKVIDLKMEGVDLNTLLRINTVEFKRIGVQPRDPAA